MKKVLLAVLMLVFSGNTCAEIPDWYYQAIKKENPNELAYWVGTNECPVTKEEIEKIADGVFIRSRIKPLNDEFAFLEGSLLLVIDINCVEVEQGGVKEGVWAARYDVRFGQFNVMPATSYPIDFGAVGLSNKESILSNVKKYIENAMTAYIKANFNL